MDQIPELRGAEFNQSVVGDVAAYVAQPMTVDERAVADLPVAFDLADADVDYDAIYETPT